MSLSPEHFPPQQIRMNRLIWLVLGLSVALDLAWIHLAGITLVITNGPILIFMFGVSAFVSLFHRFVFRDKALFLFGEIIAQTLVVGFIIITLILMGARLNMPLVDEQLIAIDKLFGFNWRTYIDWAENLPVFITQATTFAYQSYGLQAVLLIPMLFIFHQTAHAQRFIIIFYLTGMATVPLASLFPAIAGFLYYDIDVSHFHNLHPAAAYLHKDTLMAMREHVNNTITYPGVGIVTFPSYHAVMAFILSYISLPFRYTRLIVIPLNILMLISTLSDGGHYLTDVLAGILIALTAIFIAEKLVPRHGGRAVAV